MAHMVPPVRDFDRAQSVTELQGLSFPERSGTLVASGGLAGVLQETYGVAKGRIREALPAWAQGAFDVGISIMEQRGQAHIDQIHGLAEGLLKGGKEFAAQMEYIKFNWQYEMGNPAAMQGDHKFEAFYRYMLDNGKEGLLVGLNPGRSLSQTTGRFIGEMAAGILRAPVDTGMYLSGSQLMVEYARNRVMGQDTSQAFGGIDGQLGPMLAQGALDVATLGAGNLIVRQGGKSVAALETFFKTNRQAKAQVLELVTETVGQAAVTTWQSQGKSTEEILGRVIKFEVFIGK